MNYHEINKKNTETVVKSAFEHKDVFRINIKCQTDSRLYQNDCNQHKGSRYWQMYWTFPWKHWHLMRDSCGLLLWLCSLHPSCTRIIIACASSSCYFWNQISKRISCWWNSSKKNQINYVNDSQSRKAESIKSVILRKIITWSYKRTSILCVYRSR